jgi:chromosome segregation ATPase
MFLLVLVLLVVTGINLYLGIQTRKQLNLTASKQEDQLNLITRRLDASDERYSQLRGQFEVTSEKLGLTQEELSKARTLASNIQKQQQQAVQQLNAAIAQKASAEQLDKLQADASTKFGSLSGDIAGTRKDLEATKEALMGAKSELSGAIARTHDELVALAHRSDRDFFEFTLARKKARQKIGTLVIELDKADAKKNLYTVNLYFDDKRTPRKDKAVNEPVYFYVQGASSALELVVNKVGKDTIAGYISTPKGFFPGTPTVLAARPGG